MVSSIILLCCIITIVIYMFKKNNNFIDFRSILKKHFSIFKKNRVQLLFFYILPLIMAICVANLGIINQEIVDNVIIVLGIFVSIFFSIIDFVIGFPKETTNGSESYAGVHEETFSTLMFEVIICILALILSFTYIFFPNKQFPNLGKDMPIKMLYIWSLSIYYLIIVALLNMFIVIKRLKKLYDVQ